MPEDDSTCLCRANVINDFEMFSSETLRKKANIFLFGIQNRIDESITFIHSSYPQREKLKLATDFIGICFNEAFKTANFEELTKIGFFPSSEAQMEFDQALKHCFFGSYKAAYGFLRRAFELTFLHIYFAVGEKYAESILWQKSKTDTQFFSKAFRQILKNSHRFKDFNNKFFWELDIKIAYHDICDYLHVRGISKGFREINKTRSFFDDSHHESVSLSSLKDFLDCFIGVAEHICVALALYNPIILEGLDLDAKFGLNTPMSGFFYPGQTEILMKIIPLQYHGFFEKIKLEDEEFLSILSWFNGLDDLSEEQIEAQAREFRADMEALKKKK